MPLTPAEKMKRYREKLKRDPEKYEEYKKKDLKRIKLKNKKISELSEKEKAEQRKKWREYKKKKKEKKADNDRNKTKNTSIASTEAHPSTSTEAITRKCFNKNHMLTIRRLRRMYETAVKKNKVLQQTIEKNRKKFYRFKTTNLKTIDSLNKKILKMKAREEVMESTLCSVYKASKLQKERRVLKSIADTDIVKKNKCKTYLANLLGLRGRIRRVQRVKARRNIKIKEELTSFFIRDDISRSTSGKKECKTVKKEKHQIRYLTDTLYNLYQIYKREGGRFSFTTFFRHKPAYVLSPNIHNRDTCLCIKHANMDLLFSSLIKNNVMQRDIKSLRDVISALSCDQNSYNCMYGRCVICRQSKLMYSLEGDALLKRVGWDQWERVDHTYDKIENGVVKEKKTKKMVKNRKNGIIKDLIEIFEKNIPNYKVHIYNWKHQQLKYREKIEKMEPNEALILCDFSENYECKSHEEVQATHFGASKHQITLHCGMIYWASGSQSFCSISDSKCHEPGAIWAHILPIIKLLNSKCPGIKNIHFFSDGPSSQYRQKKNFALLNWYTKNLKLDICTWNFSESGHGKGVADGIGGSVKRTLDKQVAYGKDVRDGEEAFRTLVQSSRSIEFFYIQDIEIERVQKIIAMFHALKAVPGTLQIHQVICSSQSSHLLHRVLSCFCKIEKDNICECYNLKKHLLPSILESSVQLASTSVTEPILDDFTSTDITELVSVDLTSTDIIEPILVDLSDVDENLCLFEECDIDQVINFKPLTEVTDTETLNLPILTELDLNSNKRVVSPVSAINELNSVKRICYANNRTNYCSLSRQCFACKRDLNNYNTTKCMSCKMWFCPLCSEGNNNFDYICRKCFGEDYE